MADDATLTVKLSPVARDLVQIAVDSGRYASPDAVIEAALLASDVHDGAFDFEDGALLQASLDEADAQIARREWSTVDEVFDRLRRRFVESAV